MRQFRLGGGHAALFRVDADGTIYADEPLPDHDTLPVVNLTATAVNEEGESLPANVVIYLDSRRPEVGVLNTWVYENAPGGTIVGRVPVRPGGSAVSEAFLEGDGARISPSMPT